MHETVDDVHEHTHGCTQTHTHMYDAHECIVGKQQRSLLHDMGSSSKHNEQVQCVVIITVTLISRD